VIIAGILQIYKSCLTIFRTLKKTVAACCRDGRKAACLENIPGFVRRVLETLESGGYEAYLVGGCLRDMLFGRPIHDWDVTTAAPVDAISALFPKTVETGARFGTVTVLTGEGTVEVTTFRSDGVYSDGRRPDSVSFTDSLTEDLKRRDFTINAMAMGLDGRIVDLFDGQTDLKRRRIRCVGKAEERFSEDGLRMFRALRFAAQLGFDIDGETLAAIAKCAALCRALSAERVRDETEKILLSPRPALAGQAITLGLYIGRIAAGEVPARLDRIGCLPTAAALRWAAFAACLSSAGLTDDPKRFLTALRLDAKTVRSCAAGVAAAQAGPLPCDNIGMKRLLADIGLDAARCAAAAGEVLYGDEVLGHIDEVIASGECWSLSKLAVTGEDLMKLGFRQGAGLGAALKQLLEHITEHPCDNTRETLLKLAEGMLKE
jgi:tRNA nucleotidyltransferase (CCA-adding enzyme)